MPEKWYYFNNYLFLFAVFIVSLEDKSRLFIDYTSCVYKNAIDAVVVIGARFKGGILYPEELCHKAKNGRKKVRILHFSSKHILTQVTLLYSNSTATLPENRALEALEKIVAVASKLYCNQFTSIAAQTVG